MAEDWDLLAVVRGCTTATTACSSSSSSSSTAITSTSTASSSGAAATTAYPLYTGFEPQQDGSFFGLQDLFFDPSSHGGGGVDQELHDLYKPFYHKSSPPLSPQNVPISPLSVLGGLQDLSQQKQQMQQQQQQQPPPPPRKEQHLYQPKQSTLSMAAAGSRSSGSNGPPSHRSKRRKNQLKKVCQVPAEALSSDSWSWRKYGQKPIKGSPFPRGYYRCSTAKGCMARKQVERNKSDPGTFIVTYTSEHNHPMPTHRNSLAGSTRNKPSTPQTTNSGEPRKPSSSPPVSPSPSLSSAPGKLEIESSKDDVLEDEDDDAVNGYEMAVDDDFFQGLEEFAGESAAVEVDSSFPDHLSMQFPWLTSSATTTTTAASRG